MRQLKINENIELNFEQETIVMGILNVTPDSFSDGGHFVDGSKAVEHAQQMVLHGAKIIDIGGESTRPGHDPVSVDEEVKRVVPIIREIKDQVKAPISVDTYKSKTADEAVKAGASMINDVWGAKEDPDIAHVASEHQVPIILMHNQTHTKYDDIIEDMKKSLAESIEVAKRAGVPDEHIILDPGVGFGKTLQQNLLTMRRLHELKTLGYPLLLGTSRKSMIGKTLELPVDERLEGTVATVCYGIQQGVEIVRVHDVKEISRSVKMMDSMMGKGVLMHGSN
ncbi:dihydropteroate synthase [Aquisalibacillus elongatus]|uniref:Dihydropteroate synthase n=1 Tax=Aquisalibacillus elongatus TaxID=485577 RepID=A0A3N5B1W0_9BACI|nr:dihydropteroate synthase [Aquisalibacillus elongatus]RPF51223.1 dihydropteroate synthase [Aquisalibacillus elongatus]